MSVRDDLLVLPRGTPSKRVLSRACHGRRQTTVDSRYEYIPRSGSGASSPDSLHEFQYPAHMPTQEHAHSGRNHRWISATCWHTVHTVTRTGLFTRLPHGLPIVGEPGTGHCLEPICWARTTSTARTCSRLSPRSAGYLEAKKWLHAGRAMRAANLSIKPPSLGSRAPPSQVWDFNENEGPRRMI